MGAFCSASNAARLNGAKDDIEVGEQESEVEERAQSDGTQWVTSNQEHAQSAAELTDMEEARRQQSMLQEEMAQLKQQRLAEYKRALSESRRQMRTGHHEFGMHAPANRYGTNVDLPTFEPGKHVPVLALLNPLSGAMAGSDILSIARSAPYYQDRFFNIIDVVKGQLRGGLMDVFREELARAKEEAKAMGTRPRLISGGGDGTGSFALFIVFTALKADDERVEDGLQDTGNGFVWTDAELEESFPALAQMPLGSANDFGNVLGWGQKYPGDRSGCCSSRDDAAAALVSWIDAVLSPDSSVVNFDIWGLMPARSQDASDFKIAELTGRRGCCPNPLVGDQRQLLLKVAGKPVPFFVCLYFSVGFGAYMTSRFQINRRKTPIKNRLEYIRQAIGIIREAVPPQMNLRLNGVQIDCSEEHYFPPRQTAKTIQGRRYREVGFLNINWQAHLLHGADRASVRDRFGRSAIGAREPVRFNDGLLDMYRWKFKSLLKNPGPVLQTDKRRDLFLTFTGEKGKGVFFQWDGEARFAFSVSGEPFHMHIRKVLTVPVVLGPFLNSRRSGFPVNGERPKFEFSGDTEEAKELARKRVLALVCGQLDEELIATREDIEAAGLRHADFFTSAEEGSKVASAEEDDGKAASGEEGGDKTASGDDEGNVAPAKDEGKASPVEDNGNAVSAVPTKAPSTEEQG
eukprot:CAMPEP_0171069180 /NCGR_PEP_ID=MMETSP0766_2-20121228/8994_1 /TAXON_ID=439317 /ORGANISM="Gambierdiscus australes, Strain CAWD 149" /LENGTH=687 /DNA_ID=CAMNT_0011525547 /DNA_START=32 /DNA_END=2095 /DNA_ORIENTATION=+